MSDSTSRRAAKLDAVLQVTLRALEVLRAD
jgi:hypothetical protein